MTDYFPRVDDPIETTAMETSARTLYGHETILVIEDDVVALRLFQEILAVQGYDVRVAADAESGLREIARAAPAAVLLDLRLPLADGLAVLRALRAGKCADLPVAIMTGDYFVDDRVVRDIEALGARVHFKPLFEDDLRQVVSGLLRHAHDPDQDQHGPM